MIVLTEVFRVRAIVTGRVLFLNSFSLGHFVFQEGVFGMGGAGQGSIAACIKHNVSLTSSFLSFLPSLRYLSTAAVDSVRRLREHIDSVSI